MAATIVGRLYLMLVNQTPVEKRSDALRVGVLGAAGIGPMACMRAIAPLDSITVHAVAARDKDRAAAYARRNGIPKVFGSYEELVSSNEVDIVYIPSPNGLHLQHALLALKAGKHIVVEKPIASNEEEAQMMDREAKAANKVAMEAFHYRFHPAIIRAKEIAMSEAIGSLESVTINCAVPGIAFSADDIRFNFDLAGGTMMDLGCYAVSCLRYFIGTEPSEVESVHMDTRPSNPQVDRSTKADLKFPLLGQPDKFITAKLSASLDASIFGLKASLTINGQNGTLEFNNFLGPHAFHSIKVTDRKTGHCRSETQYGSGQFQGATTYTFMWQGMVDAIKDNKPFSTTLADGALTMRVIDMIYTAAGLQIRKGKVAESSQAAPSGTAELAT